MIAFKLLPSLPIETVIHTCHARAEKFQTGGDDKPLVDGVRIKRPGGTFFTVETCPFLSMHGEAAYLPFVCMKSDPECEQHIEAHRHHMTARGKDCSGFPNFEAV